MKNVKVILISAVLCTAIFANQRIAALGGDAGFWSGDRANDASFPATINDHSFVEFDSVGNQTWDDDAGDDGEGAWVDNAGIDASILWGDATKWGFNFNQNDDNTWFSIAWGNGDMGLNVSYLNNDNGNDVGTDDVTGFMVGYGQNFDWGELGVGFNSVEDYSSYWANWRGDLDAWVFDSAKASLTSTDDGADHTTMALGFDMFTHLDAGGADVLFGLGVDYVTDDMGDVSTSAMTLPSATIAVEAALTDWATVRGFANHTYVFSCDGYSGCNDDGSQTSSLNSTDYGFGLGFDWGQLNVDISIGEGLFTNPVAVMTGNSMDAGSTNRLAGYAGATLSYTF